jgi:TPR repeat protein
MPRRILEFYPHRTPLRTLEQAFHDPAFRTLTFFTVLIIGITLLMLRWQTRTDQPSTEHLAELQDKAMKGDPEAALRLGFWYAEGTGVTRSYQRAAKWWRVAAEAGIAGAQLNLGRLYARGQGVEQDWQEAFAWFGKAADQGHARAQCELAQLFDAGQGVAQDYSLAAAWYMKAAEQGDARAQAHLAKLCYRGAGVEKSVVDAFVWVSLAAVGSTKYEGLRDKLLTELSPEQQAEAKARLRRALG